MNAFYAYPAAPRALAAALAVFTAFATFAFVSTVADHTYARHGQEVVVASKHESRSRPERSEETKSSQPLQFDLARR
jgi:hypothetical protein